MGLIKDAPLIITPHPVTLEGQRTLAAQLQEGERLGGFLARVVPDYTSDLWEVRINGVVVPHEVMDRVRPKDGTVIEVRGVVKKTALMIVALIALTVFTMGVGTAIVAAGYSAAVAGLAQGAIYAAGALLIQKVLGPKRPKPSASDASPVYTIGAARNQPRPYQPLPLLLGGPLRIAPDVASNPYTWYEADDQYLAMTLTAGINVGRVEALYNGDALLSSFEGVTVWHNGFSEMPSEAIPLYSNADTINGGALEAEKGQASPWVQRTSSPNTIRLKVDVDFMLFDTTSKGKPKDNRETIEIQYRAVGIANWSFFGSYSIVSRSQKQQRRSYSRDVPEGQYEVRVRIAGHNTDGSGATSDFTWSTLTSIQKDTADYAGLARIGIRIKATGQLNGQPDEIRCVAYAEPAPVWTEAGWSTQETNNPGALILAYARGFRDENGKLIAGIGLDDVQIDIEALKTFMLFCQANGYGYSNYIKDVRNHDDVLNAVALAGFGQITWAGGRLSVVWAGSEQPLSGVVNMATIKKGQFQVDYTLANAADGIEYSYYDATDWTTKTLRVAAPGVTTMLNPATVEGEGITNEAHAARMARYHLAQSLYQYKDITYSTDIEHLSYRRLSVLALQHDLTQWGAGGRIVSATAANGVVTLQLDEPVQAPTNGNAWIGLRIPGERVYRVFGVQPFTGTSDTIRLTGSWPGDAPLPGDTPDNPAHDTIWIYDFKQTPGYRVRVVGIEPESDLKGAKVSVVPEPPEFWNYVLTGEYVPPVNTNPITSRPVASGLAVTEQQVVQGDTVFTELTVTFEISGPVGNIVVLAAGSDGVLSEVAQTTTRTATWRISHADQYTVVVRPFSPDGRAGVAASVTYITAGADVPPRLVDFFDVDELSGGVRMYTWGFLANSIQSPDFAGVEIRYMQGAVLRPEWEQMIPIGGSGYHAVPFEAVVPESGDWTFACRSVNTSGELSTEARVITKKLGANLGQVIDKTIQELIDARQRIDQEKIERFNEDARVASEAAADATKKANDAMAAAIAHADAIGAIVADLTEADEWEAGKTYPVGDFTRHDGKLYRALRENTDAEPGASPDDWQLVGNFSGVGEALAASIDMAYQNASDLAAEAGRINAIVARMPAGDGKVASVEAVDAVSGRVEETEEGLRAVGDRTSSLEAQMTYKHAGDRDWNAGDRNVYAGVRTWQSVIVQGDRAVAKTVDSLNVELGNFKASATKSIELIATEQASQAEQIEHVGAELEGKASSDYVERIDARVAVTENGIEAVTGQLASVKAEVSGKASAEVVQGMEARVVQNENGLTQVLARAFLNVIANSGGGPLIGGMVIDNNGQVINTRFSSNTFEVISPGASEGMEWRGGFLRVWKGSAQRIIGTNFGAAGDNLVDYFGPNVGAGAASKANAVIWMDANGSAYFGGQLSAGILRNAVQTTTTQTVGVELVNGPFATNGRVRSVTVSFSRRHVRTKTTYGTDGFVAGGGQNTARVEIYRRVGEGAESLWQVLNASGGVNILNETDGPDNAISDWGGSFTVNDTSTSAQTITYRAVITSFTEQAVSHTSGSFQQQSITQSLSIISVEN
ncbi:carbohydrate-binding protein [Stenotrophomonas maltophilia]|uniref:host specificity factor TipJ family phage tail protein n=1 Tax=Stenotrophomonas maltophilia TaxID=40324 RepID=UPI0021C5F3A7|nr:host specificity factor TipJ family phage tail protein [Stenotrophomonas maltophilia]MCU1196132.1 carbohydrate-binding protein [Stenotrophomonas maltophilia]